VDVAAWLNRLGLDQYEQAFRENDVDADVVPELTAEDLIGLGVTSIGHRRKLLAAIAALREQSAPASEKMVPVTALTSEAVLGASKAGTKRTLCQAGARRIHRIGRQLLPDAPAGCAERIGVPIKFIHIAQILTRS
jgi:hypothetical protein